MEKTETQLIFTVTNPTSPAPGTSLRALRRGSPRLQHLLQANGPRTAREIGVPHGVPEPSRRTGHPPAGDGAGHVGMGHWTRSHAPRARTREERESSEF